MEQLRKRLVSEQVEARGVRDPLVLAAMRKVPRELFVPQRFKGEAYEDRPLSIGAGQTISQPYIVAFMVEALALRGGEKVLEIGAGSGYAAAILAEIAGEVFTIERIGQLAERAAASLADAGYHNVHVRHADGTEGWIDRGCPAPAVRRVHLDRQDQCGQTVRCRRASRTTRHLSLRALATPIQFLEVWSQSSQNAPSFERLHTRTLWVNTGDVGTLDGSDFLLAIDEQPTSIPSSIALPVASALVRWPGLGGACACMPRRCSPPYASQITKDFLQVEFRAGQVDRLSARD